MKILFCGNYYVGQMLKYAGCDVFYVSGKNPDLSKIWENSDKKFDIVFIAEELGKRKFPLNFERIPVKKVFYGIDVHLNYIWHKYYGKAFDVVFFTQKSFAEKGKREGLNSFWIPWGTETKFFKDYGLPKIYDISFCGKVNFYRLKRKKLLQRIAEKFEIKLFGTDDKERIDWDTLGKIYNQSKIVINEAILNELNFRVFEATGSKALLLTEKLDGLEDIFEDKKEIIVFNPKNFLDLISYYLENDKERKEIAEMGYLRTHKEHTFEERGKKMREIIEKKDIKAIEEKEDVYLNLCKAYYFAALRKVAEREVLLKMALDAVQKSLKERRYENLKWCGIINLAMGDINSAKLYLSMAKSEKRTFEIDFLLGFVKYKEKGFKYVKEYFESLTGNKFDDEVSFWLFLSNLFPHTRESLSIAGADGVPLFSVDFLVIAAEKRGSGKLLRMIGDLFYKEGYYEPALRYYLVAERMGEKMGDELTECLFLNYFL